MPAGEESERDVEQAVRGASTEDDIVKILEEVSGGSVSFINDPLKFNPELGGRIAELSPRGAKAVVSYQRVMEGACPECLSPVIRGSMKDNSIEGLTCTSCEWKPSESLKKIAGRRADTFSHLPFERDRAEGNTVLKYIGIGAVIFFVIWGYYMIFYDILNVWFLP